MKTIRLSELQGYLEDKQSLARFERRFAIPSILGVGIFLVVFLLVVQERLNWVVGVPVCLGSLANIFLVVRIMERQIPISRQSGLKMDRYLRADGREDEYEIVYVCHPSKTYFRRVFYSHGA